MNTPNRLSGDAEESDTSFHAEIETSSDWPAWMLSVVIHATLLIACGLLAPVAARPPMGEPERVVGIALVPRAGGSGATVAGRLHSAAEGTTPELPNSPSGGGSAAGNLTSQLPDLDSLRSEFAATLPQPGDAAAGVGLGVGLPQAGGMAAGIPGDRMKGAMGGQASTQVFGARGTGNKFVYVFDRSASMGGFNGRPLAAAKAELAQSLADLGAIHQFQILFYNDQVFVFNPSAPARPTMLFATDENRKLAQTFLQGITPYGGTKHLEALETALGMGPDVLFFLTDADEPELSADELASIRRRNRAGTAIHCIEFGVGPSRGYDNFLVQLARQNRGQHVYVDVTTLRRGP